AGHALLQLDEDLAIPLPADVLRGLDATRLDVDRVAGEHVGFDVVLVRAFGIGLGDTGNAIAGDLHEDVVDRVLVNIRRLSRRQIHLPDPHPVVLEQDAAGDVPQRAFLAHQLLLASRGVPTPISQNDRVTALVGPKLCNAYACRLPRPPHTMTSRSSGRSTKCTIPSASIRSRSSR